MKKDYTPISENDAVLSETAFIERFWTKIWDDRHPNIAKSIESREEFRFMKCYLSGLPANARILDGGCGMGDWTVYFSMKGYETIGMDLSRATIEKLNEKFPAYHFTIGDIRNTEFESDSFDIYFSWGTFEHFEDGFTAPLAEARRILKKGGYLFISVPFHNGRLLRNVKSPLWRWDENFDKIRGYRSKMRFYQWRVTQSELQQELEINGFKMQQVKPIHKLHGLRRAIKHDMKINPRSIPGKALQVLLYPFIPNSYIAHMIVAVGQKV